MAVARQVVESQRLLIGNLRRRGRCTLAAEATLAEYEAAEVLRLTPAEQARVAHNMHSLLRDVWRI